MNFRNKFNKCPRCNKKKVLEYGKNSCTDCLSAKSLPVKSIKKKHDKCPGCSKKKILKYENNDLCSGCYSAQFQSVNSGNIHINNLIKATHKNNIQFRLEWIPFGDFTKVQKIAEGGFSKIFIASWKHGKVKSYNGGYFNRTGHKTVVLKILNDSQNINSEFIKEVNYTILLKPNQTPISVVLFNVMEYHKNK
ncbi:10631_t:CDS:2 [Acaulospora morrowiae]|uniref:10631_t:CDS:1 n=1 Tax=Acaulospora morrowiae TaxID=94023 RepID=A0A9N9HK09_9GLOM|nr:10631_t:CDS:2 [Acaulospora morrowiae]